MAGKTLLDLCAGEGYFSVRFMLDGGREACAIDTSKSQRDIASGQASSFNVDVNVQDNMNDISKLYDYVLYLDTHYHSGTEVYLERIKDIGKMFFISCCNREDRPLNDRLEEDLKDIFKRVSHVFTGSYGRKIFKCS